MEELLRPGPVEKDIEVLERIATRQAGLRSRKDILKRITLVANEALAGWGLSVLVPEQPMQDAVVVYVVGDSGHVAVCVTNSEARLAESLDSLVLHRVMNAAATIKHAQTAGMPISQLNSVEW